MRRGMISALVAASLMLVAPIALARTTSYPTTVHADNVGFNGNEVSGGGYVTSPRARCIARRTVRVFALYDNSPPELLGTDSTSRNGAFFVSGHVSEGAIGVRAKAPRKRFGRRHHRKVCRAATDDYVP